MSSAAASSASSSSSSRPMSLSLQPRPVVKAKRKNPLTYIYCRVSSILQLQGVSLDAQLNACSSTAAMNNLKEIVKIQEVCSARHGLPPLLSLLANKKKITLICYSIDRFSRNVELGMSLAKKMLENGCTLIFLREQLFLTGTSNINKLRDGILAAQTESDAISSRIKMVRNEYKQQGYHIGPVPYGYFSSPVEHTSFKRLEEDPYEQKVLEFIRLCSQKGPSVKDINQVLAELSPMAHSDPLVFEAEETTEIEQEVKGDEEKKENRKRKSHGRQGTRIKKVKVKHAVVIDRLERYMCVDDIAGFLNEYGISYRGRHWTRSIVSNIVKKIFHSEVTEEKEEKKEQEVKEVESAFRFMNITDSMRPASNAPKKSKR